MAIPAQQAHVIQIQFPPASSDGYYVIQGQIPRPSAQRTPLAVSTLHRPAQVLDHEFEVLPSELEWPVLALLDME
jgi:hypothetical protein